MITDEFIGFETAKLAKDKGFAYDQFIFVPPGKGFTRVVPGVMPTNGAYTCYNEQGNEIRPKYYNANNPHYPRPTQSLLQKWLREEKGIHVHISFDSWSTETYTIRINQKGNKELDWDFEQEYKSYEEALEIGLQKAFKLI